MAELTEFRLNRKTIRHLAVGPECRQMVTAHAQMAKVFAVTLASGFRSDDQDEDDTYRHYQDSFEIEVMDVHGITPEWPLTRVAARLSNSSEHANFVEFGTTRVTTTGRVVETKAHHVLGRTMDFLESFNVRLDDE